MTKMREPERKQLETERTAANELIATYDDAQKAKARDALPGLAFGPGMMHNTMRGPHHQDWSH